MAISWGKLIVGIATGYISITALRDAFGRTDAALKKLEQQCPGNDPKCRIVPAGEGIEPRAKFLAEMIWESSLDPEIKRLAMATLNKKCNGTWCNAPRDYKGEAKALASAVYDPNDELWSAAEGHFAWVKENVRYLRDHPFVDSWPSAKRIAKDYHGEDCDGHTILLGALNMATGAPVGMRIYQTKGSDTWSHIAGLVQIPAGSGPWHVMDASVDKVREGNKVRAIRPGWGAPASMVVRSIDFQILPGGKVKKIGSWP